MQNCMMTSTTAKLTTTDPIKLEEEKQKTKQTTATTLTNSPTGFRPVV